MRGAQYHVDEEVEVVTARRSVCDGGGMHEGAKEEVGVEGLRVTDAAEASCWAATVRMAFMVPRSSCLGLRTRTNFLGAIGIKAYLV